ncbi:hypothetical protein DID77_01580 [Candidatus Marinamargulisbacteria bacterium SCGC AG-439-L15]|nr:hypothetical protein DID77_01580 [Candidatus Marinamargulisbacteria bacterium SCGC AG-439-L15]
MIKVIKPGMQTTVQDYPGRVGYWDIGIPPSGCLDDLSLRTGNCLLGNPEGSAGLEMTTIGAHLLFTTATTIVLTGAEMPSKLGGHPISFYESVDVAENTLLEIGNAQATGMRSYLTVLGGIDVPDYLGSKATFPFGQFGGHEGRALKAGDTLKLGKKTQKATTTQVPESLRPTMGNHWEIRALLGPHAAPDYFTKESENLFFSTHWEVHYQSNRLGFRLLGPEPEFTRETGGEGGRHPSNLHDYVYSVGSINFTGNMPIILSQDGPSLGGFVCIATIASADKWILGQVRPKDTILFHKISHKTALTLKKEQQEALRSLSKAPEKVLG